MKSSFMKNLKSLRMERGISQAQLAQQLNITVKTISHWETGYSEPSIQQILDIADYFQIATDDLLKP